MPQIVKLLLEEQSFALLESELSLLQPGQYYLNMVQMLFSSVTVDDSII